MKKVFLLLLLLVFLPIMSCQDVLECIINRRPELADKTLAMAELNQFYSEKITSDIKNEAFDDGYAYYFSIDGQLPRGISYYIDYRDVILEGVPLVTGRYTFTVRLSVEQLNDYLDECESSFNDCDGLCNDSTSKSYTIWVN